MKIFYCIYNTNVSFSAVCQPGAFHCGDGFCVDSSAECNGFKDCVINYAEEIDCGSYYLNTKISNSHDLVSKKLLKHRYSLPKY